MIQEFEGKSEKDAIDKAIKELALDQEEFDVEIVEAPEKRGLFRKGSVRIRVHVSDEDQEALGIAPSSAAAPSRRTATKAAPLQPESELEKTSIEFVERLIEKMGYPGTVSVQFREERKVGFDIASDHSNILIGKKGKNLDAIQLLANVYASKSGRNGTRIIIDAENYRARREDSLVRLATRMAEQVRRSRGSRLLEPMNPFERRLIHTALNDFEDIDTQSEGEGLYKQVRIIYRGTEIGPPPQEQRSRNGRRRRV